MPWSADQRKSSAVAAAYGYKTAVMENTLPVEDLSIGKNVIILTQNGEPVMSGTIDGVVSGEGSTVEAVEVGGETWNTALYSFRAM